MSSILLNALWDAPSTFHPFGVLHQKLNTDQEWYKGNIVGSNPIENKITSLLPTMMSYSVHHRSHERILGELRVDNAPSNRASHNTLREDSNSEEHLAHPLPNMPPKNLKKRNSTSPTLKPFKLVTQPKNSICPYPTNK